ncbi:MAG: hypothetical protein WAU88_07375 [Candidatus Zixiibacteriota bacterium]
MEIQTADHVEATPITYLFTKWWAYIFCAMFLLYGGVKLILGFLDKNYADVTTPITYLAVGLILAILATAYRDQRSWSWYGLVGVNILVAILAVMKLSFIGNIVLLIIAGAALAALFAPATKGYLFGRR